MQTITEIAILWWMAIAAYQFFDFLTDEILYSDNYLKSVARVAKALVLLPTLPVANIFTQVLASIIKVKLYEGEFPKD